MIYLLYDIAFVIFFYFVLGCTDSCGSFVWFDRCVDIVFFHGVQYDV